VDIEEQLALLASDVSSWNSWRQASPGVRPALGDAILVGQDLRGADLRDAYLVAADLTRTTLAGADLAGASLVWADLTEADLGHANLVGARLDKATLYKTNLVFARLAGASLVEANLTEARLGADLTGADLTRAKLIEADLVAAQLSDAILRDADLSGARLLHTDLVNADLRGCTVYGVSAWDVDVTGAKQEDLVLLDDPAITVDHLELAQFVYLLLNNEKIRDVIDTMTSKVVLILGRFTKERKRVLDALREALRSHDYAPVVFDFDKPMSRNLSETVSTIAHMARFIVADITAAQSIPQELVDIVKNLPSVPVQPLLAKSASPWALFDSLRPYPWVLPVYRYASLSRLLDSVEADVIAPAEAKVREQRAGSGQMSY
jgi:uncharacterized protein YjbI with pentapeptide repeats